MSKSNPRPKYEDEKLNKEFSPGLYKSKKWKLKMPEIDEVKNEPSLEDEHYSHTHAL